MNTTDNFHVKKPFCPKVISENRVDHSSIKNFCAALGIVHIKFNNVSYECCNNPAIKMSPFVPRNNSANFFNPASNNELFIGAG